MIYVTGDTHADWLTRLSFRAFPEGRELTKKDFVLVLGDFGIWDNSRREKYNLDWLEDRPWTTLFLDGNHENYDILDNLPVSEWNGGKVHSLRPSVIHLMRGQLYTINGQSLFTFGGARSHDIRDGILEPGDPRIKEWRNSTVRRLYRVNHVSWWAREMPSDEEMEKGLENLQKAGNRVSIIATHCPYTTLLEKIDGGSGLYEADKLSDYLQKIHDTIDYGVWLCGHMHINRKFVADKIVCLYEQIAPLIKKYKGTNMDWKFKVWNRKDKEMEDNTWLHQTDAYGDIGFLDMISPKFVKNMGWIIGFFLLLEWKRCQNRISI